MPSQSSPPPKPQLKAPSQEPGDWQSIDGKAEGSGVDITAEMTTVTTPSGATESVAVRSDSPRPRYPQATVVRDEQGNTFTYQSSGCVGILLSAQYYGNVGEEVACVPMEPGDEGAEPVQVVFTASDLQRLPIDPGGLVMQPNRGNVLINIDTVAYTEARTQVFDTAVFGIPVRVSVWPVEYSWDWGDGTVFSTQDPGAPWPHYTVGHTYWTTTAEGETRTITVTTSWAGEFSVAGGPALPVDGTAVTTASGPAFEVISARVSLTSGEELRRR